MSRFAIGSCAIALFAVNASAVTIDFGSGDTATLSTGEMAIFNGDARTIDIGGGEFAFETPSAADDGWASFENTGQFFFDEGTIEVRVENTGIFNEDEGEAIIALDANGPNEGDFLLRFIEGASETQGNVQLRFQGSGQEFTIESTVNAINIGDIIDIRVEYGSFGVELYIDDVLEDSSSQVIDFTQNINALVLGASNFQDNPGGFPPDTAFGSSLIIYEASFVPTPGAASLVLAAGLAATRRRRQG